MHEERRLARRLSRKPRARILKGIVADLDAARREAQGTLPRVSQKRAEGIDRNEVIEMPVGQA
jgi:hypothetical protein